MVYVKKLDGREEKFDERKLIHSLLKSGADKETAKKVVAKVIPTLYNGIETKALFRQVFKELKRIQPDTASRYDLKNALLRLGLEGYPFERYIARIFIKKGYAVNLNQIIKGQFITHEIDVSAMMKKERLMIECKHHGKPWLGCNIQTALYVYARFLDVKAFYTEPMLITNTKFSPQVMDYANGVGLKLMGWNYPKVDSIEVNVEKYLLYPITMLQSLSKENVSALLKKDILLVEKIASMDAGFLAGMLRVSKENALRVVEEAGKLTRKKATIAE